MKASELRAKDPAQLSKELESCCALSSVCACRRRRNSSPQQPTEKRARDIARVRTILKEKVEVK